MGGYIDENDGLPRGVTREKMELQALRHEVQRLKDAIRNVFNAKGRYNTQIAMCRLGELAGCAVTYPEKKPNGVERIRKE